MDPIHWKRQIVEPDDILDGIKSIDSKTVLDASDDARGLAASGNALRVGEGGDE